MGYKHEAFIHNYCVPNCALSILSNANLSKYPVYDVLLNLNINSTLLLDNSLCIIVYDFFYSPYKMHGETSKYGE